MSSPLDKVFGLETGRFAVPLGATNAILVEGVAGQNAIQLKYLSGGTLEVVGVSYGVTLTAVQLAARTGTDYLVGSSEIWSIDGPCRFYLSATGATAVVCFMRGKSENT